VLLNSTQPAITADLERYRSNLTMTQADDIIQNELIKASEDAEKKSNSGITFEILPGKMKVDSQFSLSGIKITGGEANVYKIASTAALGAAACRGLARINSSHA
jgi:hypothetical protein